MIFNRVDTSFFGRKDDLCSSSYVEKDAEPFTIHEHPIYQKTNNHGVTEQQSFNQSWPLGRQSCRQTACTRSFGATHSIVDGKSCLKPLAAACWELIIFPSAHRQHDLQANNHVDQPPPLAGRLLSYRRPPSTHAAAASSRLTSSFMKQAWPLTTVSLVIKRWVSWPMLSCAGEKNSPVEIEQQLLSHRRGSLRFINWPIVEEAYDS